MLLFLCGFSAARNSSSIPHLPVEFEPLVSLEHVNINAGSTWTRELEQFWYDVVGAAKDPRGEIVLSQIHAAGGSMTNLHWANLGLQQFHLPLGEPEDTEQVVRGQVSLAFTAEQLHDLRARLTNAGTPHTVDAEGSVSFNCPVGNRFRAVLWHGAATWFGPAAKLDPSRERGLPGGQSKGLGIQSVRFNVPPGSGPGICRFYKKVFAAVVEQHKDDSHPDGERDLCLVRIGHHQSVTFAEQREGDGPLAPYDGHHIAVYINEFERVYEKSAEAGLVWNNPRFPHLTYDTLSDALRHNEFRIKDILDPDTGAQLYTLEHEVRSLLHPGFSCRHWIAPQDAANPMVGDYATKASSNKNQSEEL